MSDTIVQDSEFLTVYSSRAVQLLEDAYRRKIQNENCGVTNAQCGSVDLQRFQLDGSIGMSGHLSISDSEDDDENECNQIGKTGCESNQGHDETRLEIEGIDHNAHLTNCNGRPELSNKVYKRNKKKTKEDFKKQMGSPTIAITLSLDEEEGSKKQTATVLLIPSVLLHQKGDEALCDLYNLSQQLSSSGSSQRNLILVLTLQSGRFAAALFYKSHCIKHTTSTRYTSRKGQGGAQSSNDNAKGKANSIGSQLRRAGEIQLRQDVASTLNDWKEEIGRCSLYFVSISKNLQKGFYDDAGKIFGNCCGFGLHKKSASVRNIPLDVGRPSFEGCLAIHDLMITCTLQQIELKRIQSQDMRQSAEEVQPILESIQEDYMHNNKMGAGYEEVQLSAPLTPLHLAARDGSIDELKSLLSKMDNADDHSHDISLDDIDVRAGVANMTALHYAAAAKDSHLAAKCVYSLLVEGHANPCILDSRNRLPYFLSSNEHVRNSFRKARSELGEDIWRWDDAKIGPPLSKQDMVEKKKKAAEKKKRQRQKQKERKAREKAEKLEVEKKATAEAERSEIEDSKQVGNSMKPKKPGHKLGRACDFCETICKRQSQMFNRLDYYYCSMDCVKRHQRELMAAAAAARLGKNK